MRGPDGSYRQVPQKTTPWASGLFVTKNGQLRRRYYNLVTRAWHWAEEGTELTLSDTGSLGVSVDGNWLTLPFVIALAWLPREPESPSSVHVRDERLEASHIRWEQPEEVVEEPTALKGEKWKPLRWRIGAISCDGKGYEISNRRRLRNARGEVTRGFWFDGRRWAHAKECGLVDLTTAAGPREDVVYLPLPVKQAADALLDGRTPEELAQAAGLRASSAWAYCCAAAQHLSNAERMRIGPQLITGEVWRVLMRMKRNDDPTLGGPLRELLDAVEERLSRSSACDCFVDSELKLSQLRLARLCVVGA